MCAGCAKPSSLHPTHGNSLEGGGVEAGGKVLQKLRLAAHDFGAAVRQARVLLEESELALLVLGRAQLR